MIVDITSENADLTAFYRHQNQVELLTNYFSNNPQPYIIRKESEFYELYPDFDFEFYKSKNKLFSYNDIDIFNHYHMVTKYTKALTSNTIKIVFYVTPLLNDKIGGVNAMYRMAQQINNIQHNNIKAYIYSYDHKKYYNRYCNNFAHPYSIDDHTFVVYPETIPNNPLNSKNIVRWILLDLGYEMPPDHHKSWNMNDLIYFWEPKNSIPNSKQLTGLWIEPFLLNRSNNIHNRKNTSCHMFRKHKHLKILQKYTKIQHPENSKALDDLQHTEIIEQFYKHKYFYSYDPNTFYNIIAPLCGCITILHPIPGVDRETYFQSRVTKGFTENSSYDAGIAYGYTDEEILKATKTIPFASQQIIRTINSYKITVHNFLNDIENYINKQYSPTNTVGLTYYNLPLGQAL